MYDPIYNNIKIIEKQLHDIDERVDDIRQLIIDNIICTTCEGSAGETYQINLCSDLDSETWHQLMILLGINLEY